MNSARHRPGLAIFVGGGIAATLDITYAILRNLGPDRDALWTLQIVASGWFGNESFQRAEAGVVGLVSHFGILFVAAAIYFIASQRFAALRTKPWICGPLFGVFVYLFMNFVVVPASAVPFKFTYTWVRLLEGFAVHAFFVGLPIALAIRKWTQPVLRA